ncbi:MAG TPA: choice-of-anchor tandem repeat GloVer-containing protein [Candidatus Sulfotelmatobacter sp.]|jgi:uncharacterized repeat protein (TIGR03803 family)|nr:choice-of-anchor tandem repeat GloVer-containing protein [Candidatus Sulfotelmatobacter sp.]
MGKLTTARIAGIAFVFFAATAIALPAQTFTTLLNFDSTNGSRPDYGSLVQGADGNLYGTTSSGGTNGEGTVFEITPSGTLTTLYNFCSLASCADGSNPTFGLVLATNGNFYGTTSVGGANNFGTVFEITSAGALTTLHSFTYGDGWLPTQLIQAANGNFYGTTERGGTGANCTRNNGCGTVFAMTPTGLLDTLYNFCTQTNCTDGAAPFSGLVQARNGKLYGTTSTGGNSAPSFFGTVFSITPTGAFTTLYNFCSLSNCTDGEFPQGGLVQGSNGLLYGTTKNGSTHAAGTVFSISAAGVLTVLHIFCSQATCNDGAAPTSTLVQGSNGNFFGTTSGGGPQGIGNVFEMSPAGRVVPLHVFDYTDGEFAYGGLVQATGGTLYGTTFQAGANGYGTIFSLSLAAQ